MKNKYHLYIKSADADVELHSDIDIKHFFDINMGKIEFPGLNICNIEEGKTLSKYKVYYNDTNKDRGIFTKGNILTINIPSKEINESSIAYITYVMIEKNRADHNSLTAHAACVNGNNSGILLLGNSGSGKTLTSISLCNKHKFSLIANDLCILTQMPDGKLIANEGTKFINLRKASIKNNLPILLSSFNEQEHIDDWQNKIKITPDSIGIKTMSCTKITHAFFIHIETDQTRLYVESGNNGKYILNLNQNFCAYIRNANTTFLDKNYFLSGYVPSLDCEQYYWNRVSMIKHLIFNCNLQYVSGNLESVTEYIYSQTYKK